MIAAIQPEGPGDGPISYVALHLDTQVRERKLWVPIHRDHESGGALTREQAAQLCVIALQAQVEPLVAQARTVYWACRPANLVDTLGSRILRHRQSFDLSQDLAFVWANLSRLLDAPTEHDEVALDGVIRSSIIAEARDNASTARLITVHQLRGGRVLARLGIREMARAAGVSPTAVTHLETGFTKSPRPHTRQVIRAVLERHGVVFGPGGWIRHADDEGTSPGALIEGPCVRCGRAGDLVEAARQVLDQARRVLRYPLGDMEL